MAGAIRPAGAFRKLKDDGSFVLDLGGAYELGSPTRSLYNFGVPIFFCDELGFHLAEDFYWHNPAKLPSPIEWVNKRKLRAKDSVNTVWWFGKTRWPKANVSKVLTEYSDRMKKLLEDPEGFYTPKNVRPATTSANLLAKTMAARFRQTFCKSRILNPTAAICEAAKRSARKAIPHVSHQNCRNFSSVS
jgi:hypothetical protein